MRDNAEWESTGTIGQIRRGTDLGGKTNACGLLKEIGKKRRAHVPEGTNIKVKKKSCGGRGHRA